MPHSPRTQTQFQRQLLQQIVQPHRLMPSLTTGIVTGTVGVLLNISFASLIFSGSLSSYLPVGIGMVLFSSAITRTLVALTSSFPGIIADLDPVPAAILGWSAATIVKRLPASTSDTEILITIIATIALTSLVTGVFLLSLGLLRVGEWVKRVPHSIVGGFLASTGWLLVQGAFEVMTDDSLSISRLFSLFHSSEWIRWAPGLLFAVHLLVISRRYAHFLVMPINLLGSIGIFYGFLSVINMSVVEASRQGLLLGPFSMKGAWQPLNLSHLPQIHWSIVTDQLSGMITVAMISALSVLLASRGLALATQQTIDLNRELKVTGLANLVVGLNSGIVCFHTLSDSILAHKMGGRTRLMGVISAIVCLAALGLGPTLLSYFPKAVLGGLLLYLGISMLVEWLIEARSRLSRLDYGIVILILGITASVGFLCGILVGWIAVVLLSFMTRRRPVARITLIALMVPGSFITLIVLSHLMRTP
nr:MAG: SulP family inorganic anion transporter [Leptolyngbya sp. IPPAS B-1204]